MNEEKCQALFQAASKAKAEYDRHCSNVVAEKAAVKEAKKLKANLEEALVIVRDVIQAIQQTAHKQIADVVTQCLQAIFGEKAYQFQIDFEQARGQTEVHLYLTRNKQRVDPMEAAGGGVADVVSFALRVSSLALSNPRIRPFLCLDEPFKFLSRGYRLRVRSLIEQLSEERDFQFLLVTHFQDLEMGKVIRL